MLDAQFLLNEYSKTKLDTAVVERQLQRNITDAQTTLDNLLQQKKWLEEINGADAEERVELANKLNQEIRNEVENYNKNVKEHQLQETKLAEAQLATQNKEDALLADYLPKFRETKSETYAISAEIQNAFINDRSLTNQDFIKKTELTSYLNGTVKNYYTLADGNYELKVEDADVTLTPPATAPNANDNTASTMVTETADLLGYIKPASGTCKFVLIDTPQKEAEADAKLPGMQAYMNELATTYNAELGKYNTAKVLTSLHAQTL